MFRHQNLKLFITHGGYNSFDQKSNSHLPEKLGFEYKLDKTDISNKTLYKAVKSVLKDEKYIMSVESLNSPPKKLLSNEESLSRNLEICQSCHWPAIKSFSSSTTTFTSSLPSF